MLSQIHGAIFKTFGLIKQSVNGKKNIKSLRGTSGLPSRRQSKAATVNGIKRPVFFSQNQKGFSRPWSQPNCHSKNFPASTALLWVDHHICGSAITEATTAKVIQ